MTTRVELRGSFVTDHRGQRLRVHWPDKGNKFLAWREVAGDLPPETARRVRQAVNRGYFGPLWWRAAVLIAIIFTVAVIFLAVSPHITRAIGPQGMTGWMGWIMPVGFGLLIYLTVTFDFALERMYARRRFANALLDENHCPRCLYSLQGLQAEDGGRTVCPECGAAWKV